MSKTGGSRENIECPTGLFSRQEAEVSRLTKEIHQARTASAKAPWAQELVEVADVLVNCEQYDKSSQECQLCGNFSETRHKAATLILRAGRMATDRQDDGRP